MKRFLVVHTAGGLGDVLLARCVPTALRECFGGEVDFLCLRKNAAALRDHPDIGEVLTLEQKAPKGDWWAWRRRLQQRNYDAALILWSTSKLAWLLWAARIPVRVGQDSRLLYSFLYTHKVRVRSEHGDTQSHWTQILLDYVRALGCQPSPPQVTLSRAVAVERDRPLIGFHSSKGLQVSLQRWPTEVFAGWARALHDDLGAEIAFTGSASEAHLVDDIIARSGVSRFQNLCGKTDLSGLVDLASSCDAFVCPDSGPMHVAAASGARVVGIYALGEDFPQRWAPLTERMRIVRPAYLEDPTSSPPLVGQECRGCVKAECPDFRCYRQILPHQVVEAVRSLWEQFPPVSPFPPHSPSDKPAQS